MGIKLGHSYLSDRDIPRWKEILSDLWSKIKPLYVTYLTYVIPSVSLHNNNNNIERPYCSLSGCVWRHSSKYCCDMWWGLLIIMKSGRCASYVRPATLHHTECYLINRYYIGCISWTLASSCYAPGGIVSFIWCWFSHTRWQTHVHMYIIYTV